MKVLPYLDAPISQAEFAQMVGVSEASISSRVSSGVLVRGDTAHEWLITYCEHLRDTAAGRGSGAFGGLDLVQERAALARSQREAQDLKNAVARGEYAPIGLLADVLGKASAAVVGRMDQIEGTLRKACPDLSQEALDAVLNIMAKARNDWIANTAKLVVEDVDALDAEDHGGED